MPVIRGPGLVHESVGRAYFGCRIKLRESIHEGLQDCHLLVGYHGEPKVNLFHNIRII